MSRNKPHIVVDSFPLVDTHFSGVGHSTLGFVRAIDELAEDDKLTYSLVAPWTMAHRLHKYRFKNYKRIIKNPISNKMIHGIMKFKIPFPMDFITGKGYYFFPSFLAWPTWFSKATVVVHDATYLAVPECVEKNNRKFLERVVPFSLKNTESVVTVSNFSKDELIKYYGLSPKEVHVAYNSVDLRHFYPRSEKEIHKVKAKYDIFSDKYILSVGNVEPRKNYGALIDAYTSLPKKVTDEYPLVIVGAGGWNNQEILDKIQAAKENGYRIINPKQFVLDEDMPALYSGASLFVFVPKYEGFGMSPLEAYACKTPVICSDIPPLHESAGRLAKFVSHKNPEQISKAIQDALENGLTLDEKARREHLNTFEWRKSASVILSGMTGLPQDHFYKETE